MRRLIAVLAALLIFISSAVTVATAARNDRDRGVRPAEPVACGADAQAKPADTDGTGNGNGNGGGNGGGNGSTTDGTTTDGTTTDDTRGNGNGGGGNGNGGGNGANGGGSGGATNGNGGGNGNAGGNGGGGGNANGGGNGNAGGNGNGHGNGGRGHGERPCVPPADPAGDRVAGGGKLPAATVGESVNVETTSGIVRVKQPGQHSFEPLADSAQLPARTILDTRDGAVLLTSATGEGRGQQTAAFTGAKFQVRQRRAKAAVTELVLRGGDFRGCRRLDHDRRATQIRNGFIAARGAARGARRGRGLWGTGRGRFRTRGRWGSATVRGTVWHVADRCDGTLTTVTHGVVQVADFGLDRTVSVRAGESYFARVRR